MKDQLGHHSIQVTVDLYGHLVPGANRDAVDRLAAATNCNLYATGEETREEKREVTSDEGWSRRWDLNPRPADYEALSASLAGHAASHSVVLRYPYPRVAKHTSAPWRSCSPMTRCSGR